jgi:hypothetical protein
MVQYGTLVQTELENGCSNLGRDSVKPGTNLKTIEIKLLSLPSFHPPELQMEATLPPTSYYTFTRPHPLPAHTHTHTPTHTHTE